LQTKEIREKLEDQEAQLEDQKNDTNNLLQIKSIQQQNLIGTIGEQNTVLEVTKGKEVEYQNALSDTKKRAAEIRNRIYELFDVGKQITFGQAVEIAKWAAAPTGIRPAFLLAILTQESNLGKNVGTCNRVGDPPEKSWKVIMKPDRDQEPFKKITTELGLDPDRTPVSCPMRGKNGVQIGWGGAMGPAQFIPSTWMGYKDKVSAITGKKPADPWDIRDAFLASALKLKSGGADGTDDGEWKAAMRYFSGSTNLKYRFYGDNVIATTKQYIKDIEDLR
jgi:membrane-bound lytic murein transglycosylase B